MDLLVPDFTTLFLTQSADLIRYNVIEESYQRSGAGVENVRALSHNHRYASK